ncbi:MAG TPA: hypothetical protein V6D47_04800 [Oscillatoriaceae cyanobacterium]
MTPSSLTQAVVFQPEDNPDWGHARNRRLALRTAQAEWSQPALTETLPDGFYALMNDFSYEGLLWQLGRESWKCLDTLAFQLRQDDAAIALTPGAVEATPERVTYHYASPAGELRVSYGLLEPQGEAPGALVVDFKLEGKARGVTLALKPRIDVRHMYEPSEPTRLRVRHVEPRALLLATRQRWLAIGTDADLAYSAKREVRDVAYRLGQGERLGVNGQIVFKQDYFKVMVPGTITLPLASHARVTIAAGETEDDVRTALATKEAAKTKRLAAQEARLAGYFEQFPRLAPEVVYRLYAMAEKFGVALEGTVLPISGGWWFRTPWFRNVFEGFLHNQKALVALGKRAAIAEALRVAVRYQEPGTGRLPNRVPEQDADIARWEKTGSLPADYYEASDAAPLMFTLVDEFLPEIQDETLVASLWEAFKNAFAGYKASRLNIRGGNPVLLENGLLACVPSHSWINGKRVVWAEGFTVTDLPIRAPVNWQLQDILHFRDTHYTWEQYQYPTAYLPEINAQWLRMLRVGTKLAHRFADAALEDELRQLAELAQESYKPIFWNPHANFLYNIVTLERRIDGTPTAPAVEAAALLGEEVFTRQELEYIWVMARNRLLVKRHHEGQARAFGLLAKDAPERIFFDNQQYHEAVVWPRETPYLVRLLRQLGQEATIRELLDTNLAHQMDEAAMFYNNEMLSLPEGLNPSPNPDTAHNPVPVKNPMQWWSQWCDPYLGGV